MSSTIKHAIQRLEQAEDAASLVLEAERAALAEVEQCGRQAQQLVAASALRAAMVHQRTEARIERLRERMTVAARIRLERIGQEMAALAGHIGTDAAILSTLDMAIARVTEELAGAAEST